MTFTVWSSRGGADGAAWSCFLRRKQYHDGMVSLTIKLPEAVKQLLEREARQSGKSVSALIREAVSIRLRKSTAGGSLYDRARDLCGAGASGRPDLATNREVFREFGE